MIYKALDITKVHEPALILHGVNCQRVMRSGIARALFEKWPVVRESYLAVAQEEMKLGEVLPVEIAQNLYVVHCWTQEFFGYDGAVYASPEAIEKCFSKVANLSAQLELKTIYAPKIGCGLGGLDWQSQVEPLFKQLENSITNSQLIVCELPQK